MEQKFLEPPKYIFIENYIPLFDADGSTVTAMVEIYKEPQDLINRMERGLVLIWLATALGGGLIYLGLYWIVRRAAILLATQQKQLITNETFVALGEVSSAVAHSLRNPLANIRSSAELAIEFDSGPAHRNINDIIGQVDRMSTWVRELLQSLRPLNDEAEPVNLVAALHDSLMAYEHQIGKAKVNVVFEPDQTPMVLSQHVQLTQILNSLLSNAVEAMDERRHADHPDRTARCPARQREGERYRQRHERRTAHHGLPAVLHHQAGRAGGRAGAGQADHGAIWRCGDPGQP